MNKKYIYLFLLIAVILTPLGLIAQGGAWGEWSAQELKAMLGFVPESIQNSSPLLHVMVQDYEIKDVHPLFATWISALIGVALIFLIMLGIKKGTKRAE
jgi:amino acid transporter